MENLGERIKNLRTEKGLTQPQLAKLINVSKGMISLWENNENEPKATYIWLLAKIFNVSSDYILGLENETEEKIQKINKEPFEYQNKEVKLLHKKPREDKKLQQQINEIKKMLNNLVNNKF